MRHAVHATQIKFSKETMEAEKSTASNNFALAWFIKVPFLMSAGGMIAQTPLHLCTPASCIRLKHVGAGAAGPSA